MLELPPAELAKLRGGAISMIFQEPMAALDPVYTIGEQIAETIVQHEGVGRAAAMQRALDLLEHVKIPSAARRLKNYPHELSGGMRQRAMIALALACSPARAAGRRADHGARCHGADPDPAAAAPVAAGTRHGDRVRHARCRRGGGDLRPHRGDVCRPLRRDRAPRARSCARRGIPTRRGLLASTVHGGLRGRVLETIPGAPPNLAQSAARLRLRAALPLCRELCTHGEVPVTVSPTGAMVRCVRAAPVPAQEVSA